MDNIRRLGDISQINRTEIVESPISVTATSKHGIFAREMDFDGDSYVYMVNPDESHRDVVYFIKNNDTVGTYPIKHINADEYGIPGWEDRTALRDDETIADPNTAEGQKIIAEAYRLIERDQLIDALRAKKAKDLAKGDPMLEQILKITIGLSGGEDPTVKLVNDIPLYFVGENSTHFFYLGTKDGHLYRYSRAYDDFILRDEVRFTLDLEEGDPFPTSLSETEINHVIDYIVNQIIPKIKENDFDDFDDTTDNEPNNLTTTLDTTEKINELKKLIQSDVWSKNKKIPVICREQWEPTLRRLLDELMQKKSTPGADLGTDNELSKITGVPCLIESNPIDITGRDEAVYIGRNGASINPAQIEQSTPDTSLKIVS